MNTRSRSYTELIQIRDFRGRYDYLRLSTRIGVATFGFDRYLNQQFYTSHQWRTVRYFVIARDNGCDLGMKDHEIHDGVAIHHMNPMTPDQIIHGDEDILDPEFLITVSHKTHNAIHFGDEKLLMPSIVIRKPGDTKLW